MEIRYFDHAASSWPKPEAVQRAIIECIQQNGANPGRGSHQMAVQASRILFDARKKLARLFHVQNPNDITFALNTTMALNLAIKGFVKPGQHVLCTAVEHNSVRRPLEYLRKKLGIQISYVETDATGRLDLRSLEAYRQPNTALLISTHSSNLLGSILPIGEMGEWARRHQLRFLVDAAQSAGVLPIDVKAMNIDMLAFPGHKSLLGPQGTGGLYINPELQLEPLLHGGTGSQSESIEQPNVMPDKYESGTQNTPGIAGLAEGVKVVLTETVQQIYQKEWQHTQRMMEQLHHIGGVHLLGPPAGVARTGLVSFHVDGADAAQFAFKLDQMFGIAVRSGFHCTPLGHQTAGTEKTGAVRASVGFFTTDDDVDYFIDAMKHMVRQYR